MAKELSNVKHFFIQIYLKNWCTENLHRQVIN